MPSLRLAMRALARSPRYTVAAMLTLALGIGANAAIFSIVDRLVLHPFPGIADPGRVVWLFESAGNTNLDHDAMEPANFVDWRAQAKGFAAFGALNLAELTLTGTGEPERVGGQEVTAGYFAVMGLRPVAGRLFTEEDERVGAPAVAVIGHGLWQRRFGGDAAIVGKEVEINGRATTVVGVLPKDFMFPRAPDIVVPMRLDAATWADRKAPRFAALARLAPGVSVAEAAAELDVIAARLEKQYPDTNEELRVAPVPLEQVFTAKAPMMVLLIGVGVLLLIACGNVANLTLARGIGRRRELAVRAALGASRGRIAAALLLESALVAIGGALIGLLLAYGAVQGILGAIPADFSERIPVLRLVRLNSDVVLFSAGLATLATLLVGVVPALRGSRVDLASALKDGGGGSAGGSRRRLMGALVIGQLALAMLLLGGSTVTLRSFVAQQSRPLGFVSEGVATMRLPLAARHEDAADRRRFVDALLERLGGLPGARGVAAMSTVPSTDNSTVTFSVAGQPPPSRDDMPHAHAHGVTPGFFETLRLPLLEGRGFTRADAAAGASARVVVVSAGLARAVLGEGRGAVGARLLFPDDSTAEVVGVAADVPDPRPRPSAVGTLYFPYDGDDSTVVVAVRTDDVGAVAGMARAAVRELDGRQVVEAQRPLEQLLSERRSNARFAAWIVGITSAIAVILAALGMYALVAYAVGQRMRELAIRVALGATRRDVLLTVVKGATVMVLGGVIAGAALAAPVMRGLESVFYVGRGSGGVVWLALAALLLAAVGAAAALVPARKASQVDPMGALRTE